MLEYVVLPDLQLPFEDPRQLRRRNLARRGPLQKQLNPSGMPCAKNRRVYAVDNFSEGLCSTVRGLGGV